jgi:NAD(P)-dependent dehydrogenase (short-subunit alcohol dehydrogenase family)
MTDIVRDAVDAVLELSIVGSFSSVGFRIRRRLFAFSAPAPGSLRGRVVAITGPTSGLGRAAAFELAALGARLLLLGRDEAKLERLHAELMEAFGEDRFRSLVVDMGSLASVRAVVARVVASEERLDVLIDNAGAMFPTRRGSPEGIEATFATMVVGPFALIEGMLPLLSRSGDDARVISITSGGLYTQPLDLDDLELGNLPWSGPRAYARAKRAQTVLMREWDRRFGGRGITFTAMHPGWAATPGLAASLPTFTRFMGPLLRTPAQGVDTVIWLATAADQRSRSGRLFLDRRPRPFDRVPATVVRAADRRRLWSLVAGLAQRH